MDPSKMKVVDLRSELGALGLDTKGNKPALVERLKKALEAKSGKGKTCSFCDYYTYINIFAIILFLSSSKSIIIAKARVHFWRVKLFDEFTTLGFTIFT